MGGRCCTASDTLPPSSPPKNGKFGVVARLAPSPGGSSRRARGWAWAALIWEETPLRGRLPRALRSWQYLRLSNVAAGLASCSRCGYTLHHAQSVTHQAPDPLLSAGHQFVGCRVKLLSQVSAEVPTALVSGRPGCLSVSGTPALLMHQIASLGSSCHGARVQIRRGDKKLGVNPTF